MYECFHCLTRSVVWDADFSFEDYGIEGEGLINHCHCTNCGAEIEYYVPITEDDVDELKERFGDHMGDYISKKLFAELLEEKFKDRKETRQTWDAINDVLNIIGQMPSKDIGDDNEKRTEE